MNKFKNIIKKLLIVMLIVAPFSLFLNVKADSGWDSSYDSGGSSWSSSSSSGSSWSSSDYDYGSSSSYSGGGMTLGALLTLILIIFIILILCSKFGNNGNSTTTTNNSMYKDIDEEELKRYLPNETLPSIKVKLYQKFIDIQNAWMEFEYDKIRNLCTDELYNSYITQLDTLKLKFGKNIMNEFEIYDNKVIQIYEADNKVTIKVFMKVSFYDYVINSNTNEVIRGNKSKKITNNYIMEFVIVKPNTKDIKTCPNCGAPLEGVSSITCPYCDSVLVKDASDYILSKKTNINK
ncbi:MAG: TIM44-like domain-containing protein [Candidatus Coprovivens sp.]